MLVTNVTTGHNRWPRGIDRRPPRRGHSGGEVKEEKTLVAERDSLSSVGF